MHAHLDLCFISQSSVYYLLADVETRWPTLKTSGHELDNRLVGSLFHCLIVAGKRDGCSVLV